MSRPVMPARAGGEAIGLDIGGTKIAGGVVSADGQVVHRLPPVPSPATDQEATFAAVLAAVERARNAHPDVRAVGVGAAGLVDWPTGTIRWAPNNAYRAMPLRQMLRQATGLEATVDNDANAAAWAEARRNDRVSHMAFLAVGTGVGSGLVLDDRIFRGKSGLSGEVGHLIVDPTGGQRCGCGNIGCLESLASGMALGRLGQACAAQQPGGMIATVAGGAAKVTGETVYIAARRSDPAALAIFERAGYWLGVAIACLVNLFDVELVVVGGGVAAAAGELILAPARASFRRHVFAPLQRELPDIVPARLGPDAGWIGAGLLALTGADG